MLQYLDKQIRIRIISLTILLSGIFAVNTTSFAQCVSEGITATLVTNENCPKDLTVYGLVESTIQWNSIFPGAIGDYNANISCANACSTTTFTPPSGIGNQVIFQASGISCSTGQPWTGQVIINVNPEIQIGFANAGAIICFGNSSTSLTAIINGGTPPYMYTWNGAGIISGQGTTSITVNSAGNYVIQVMDQSGCPPAMRGTEVQQQLVPPSANAGVDQVICDATLLSSVTLNGTTQNSNGAIWTGGNGVFNPSNDFLNAGYVPSTNELNAGFVDLTLNTAQNGSCPEFSDNVRVYFSSPITSQVILVNPSCGQNNGAINLTVSGGNNPYTFAWSNGETTEDLTNLSAGQYAVTVTDSVGCSSQFTYNVSNIGGPQISGTVTNLICNGQNNGAIDITVNGGSQPFQYSWNNGSPNEDLINISGGNYVITVTDAIGCIATNSFTVNEPNQLSVQSTIGNVSCNGANNGSIDLTLSGGTPSYNYSWSNGETNEDLVHLGPGNYSVSITDGNGCITTQPFTVALSASSLSLTETHTNILCFGQATGAIDVTTNGGTQPYNYTWSNNVNSEDQQNLIAGNYSLTVTDANGCSATIQVNINEPLAALSSTSTHTNIDCTHPTGSIDLTVNGGTAPYTYLWSNGNTNQDLTGLIAGIYNVSISDSHGCSIQNSITISQVSSNFQLSETHTNILCFGQNTGAINVSATNGANPINYSWSNGSQNEDLSNLSAGSYVLNAVDANGCAASISVQLTQPTSALASTITATNIDCTHPTGSINLTPTGGVNPYSFSWSNAATTEDLTNLSAGTYSVIITDANGCISNKIATISANANNLQLTETHTDVNCHGQSNGAIDVTATGGTQPIGYSWSNSFTTQDLTNLVAGTYTLTATDATGCTSSLSVSIIEPTALSLSIQATNITCSGLVNGAVNLTPTGGSPNYNYLWSNNATTQDLSNLSVGNYSVTVTDSQGCSAVTQTSITQPDPITTTSYVQNLDCEYATGAVDLNVFGGTTPYSFQWSNGLTTQDALGLVPGNYSVTILDDNLCSFSQNFTVIQVPGTVSITAVQTNVTCNGLNNGAIDVTITGGLDPYIINWSNGFPLEDQMDLTAGTYTITAVDAQNCQGELTIIITEPSILTSSVTVTNALCIGANSQIDLTVNGGTQSYTYAWSNGATTQDLTNPAPGNYGVTVTDANGCQSTASATVNPPLPAITYTETHVNIDCNHPTGSINLNVSGGTTPYTYSWSNGATIEDITNLNVGSYSVTITDANGCTAVGNISITQDPNLLVLSETHVNVSCIGSNNGSINVSTTGGTNPITYLWSNNATTQDLSNLSTGTYNLVATDALGCTDNLQVTITQIPAIVPTTLVTNVVCNGQANGAIDLSITGGTAPFTYLWSNGATTQDLFNLPVGIYSVTITDVNGCTANTQATVSQPTPIVLTESHQNIDCAHPTGNIDLTVSGGQAPYLYAWSNNATVQDLTNLAVGTYSVIVTDVNECTATLSVNITQSPTMLQLSETHTNLLCNGNATASIDVSVVTGTPQVTYAWSTGQTTQDLSNLVAGTYTVIGTDALGCKDTLVVTISQPNVITATAAVNNVTCTGLNNGSISVSVSGGTPAYTYLWNTGATTQTISNLSPGTYNVTVTDVNNCVTTAQGTIVQPLTPLSSSQTHVNIDCTHPTGSIDLSVSGGTPGYTYNWSNGSSVQDLSNLVAGTYSVTVTDANGCTTLNSIVITQTLSTLILTETHTNVNCNGQSNGAINVTTTGGTAPITYSWSNLATTEDLSNLAAGTYNLIATDALGCTANLSVAISQPAVLSGSVVATNVTCFGAANGILNLTVSGGTSPYTFVWSNAATTEDLTNLGPGAYSVVMTDAHGCTANANATITQPSAPLSTTETHVNIDCTHPTGSIDLTVTGGTAGYAYAWSNGAFTQDLTGLAAGTYSVTVTDSKGCTTTNSVTITQDPNAMVLTETHTNISCSGQTTGSINLSVSGGTPNYSYSWSNGFTTEDLSNLNVGTYTVTVTDASGCVASLSTSITSPPVLELDAITSNLSCFNNNTGAIDLIVNGGQTPYSYSWSNTATTQDLTGLSAGTYTVVVTDAGNCSQTITEVITQPNVLATTETHTNVNCFGQANGFVNLSVTGGTQAYHFTWSNGATTEDINGVVAGTYTVNIVDSLGCTTSRTVVVTQPLVLANTITKVNVNCFGNSTGSINLTVTGGTSPYTYNWSNGATTEDLANLAAGTFNVTITDAHGCTSTGSATITQSTQLQIAGTVTNVTCFGLLNGAINITPTGGVGPYTYSWSNGATTEDLSNKGAGTYSITITDQLGCTKNTVFTITQPQNIVLTQTHVNILCSGGTGSIDLTVTGGTSPFTYSWSNGGTTQDIGNLAAGTYSVLVTDANGCTKNLNGIVISSGPTALVVNSTITNVNCFGQSTGLIDLTVTGGVAPYAYNWSNGAVNQDPANLSAGTYNLILTDANGCVYTNSYVVSQPSSALTISETHNDILCAGTATGLINITVTGGTGPYGYSWSNGATTEDASNIFAGNYTVTVTDGHGCVSTGNMTVSELYAPLTLTETHINVLCFGNASGYINLSVNGGAPAYSYSWSNGASIQDIGGLTIGSYSVNVTDNNGCTATQSVTITQPASALSVTETHVNLVCVNDSTGSINITPNGGTAPYAYSWSNGQTIEDISNLPFGPYTVQVTDFNNCTSNLSVSIANPINGIVLSGAVTNINCYGGATGAIDVSISGGTPAFTYSWSNNAQGQDLVNLFPGTYTVTVVDAIGCDLSQTYTITQPAAPLTYVANVLPVYCFGQNTGAITLDVTGGTPGYLYSWSNASTTEDIYNLPAGTYSGTITDANGCTATYVGVVNQPQAAISLNLTSTPSLCFGGTSGGVNLTVNGGVPSYTYSWSNGSTTEDLANVGAGTYTVTVQDQNGCLMSGSIVVGQPASALTLSQTTTHVSCYGGNNGYINLSVIGGTPAYSYLWNNAATTEDLSNISSGGYSVVVTDANGCTSNLSVLVNQPSSLVSVSGTVSNVLCYGGTTGSISSVGQGGTSPYSYAWSNGETTSQVTGLSAGLYTVTVSDANGCTANQTWSVTQPSALSLQSTNTNILCYGQSSGSITSQASGGVTPYTYTWTNGMTGQNILNVPAGPYFVTVVDGNGCSATFSDTVYQPTTALTLSTSIVNNNCFGAATGSIDNTVTGGTSPYQYQWNTSATTQDLTNLLAGTYVLTIMDANGCLLNNSLQVTQPPISIVSSLSQVNVSCLGGGNGSINLTATGTGAPFTYLWNNGSTTEDISGLVPGVYSVTITDNSGCTTSMSANITQPATSVSLQSLVTNVLCTGNNTGSIDLTVNGGTTPYFYSWSNGNGTQDLTNAIAGTYSVIVTDNNNCQVFDTLTITQPSNILTGTFTQTNVLCFGQSTGAINLTVSGGTVGYSYAWSNNALSEDITGIPAGFYSVVVTDGNGCTFNTSAIITQPVQGVQITSNITNVDCYGNSTGAIDLTLSGGLAPYTYAWSNSATTQDISGLIAGNYVVQITDANGCFSQTSYQVSQANQPLALSTVMTPEGCYGGNNGGLDLSIVGGTSPFTYAWTGPSGYIATSQDLLNVYTGIYNVTVTDVNGCSAQLSDTVSEPAAYALSHVITNVDCFGNSTGSVNLTVNGGTPGYAYNWNNGTTTQDISNVLAGTYSVVVTDANGCTLHDTVSITQPGFATTLSSVVSNVSCQGGLNGSINLTVVSANTGLTYLWNNQAVSEDISNLGAGTYTVTVTDANGCVNTLSSTVTQPAVLTLSSTTINPLCTDSLNGSIDLTVNGGTSPYTYVWNTGATTEDISGLLEGTYFVTVTDANGCSATSSIQLVDPSPISSSYTSLPAQCNGGTNGSVNVTVSGGSPGYNYVWSNGPTTEDLSNVGAGTYTLTITDNHGCTHTQLATVGQPANPITLSAAITNIGCFGTSTGAIDLTVTGGTPGYTYQWNNSATTQDLSNVTNGTYFVNVFDANGCSATDTFAILVPLNPLAISLVGTGINCFNGVTGSIDMTITGGVGPYQINWNTGSTNEDIFGLPVGTYSVNVVDANGCTAAGSLLLTGPTAPLLVSGVTTNVSCFGAATGAVNITVTGGSFPYNYAWSNNATTEDLIGVIHGVYTVSITDFNGCTTSGTYSITQPSSGAVISYNVQDVSCNGGTNGSINVNVVGGTLPYTYFWTNNAATTQDLFGIGAGSYTLNVYDDSSCVTVATISVNQPIQAVTPSTVISAVSCYGFSNGSIDLSVVGGTPGYTYVWNTGATTQDISGLVSGTYTVTITDANGCVSTHSYVVTQPSAPLTLNTSQVNVLCYGNASGFINLITTGGTSPYSYAWSNAATTEDIFNLLAGTYSVDVTDLNGCTASTQVTITQPAAGISLQETHVNVTCYGANNGSIDITPSGGTPGTSPAYSYLWSNTATTQDITSLIAGTYTVLVTDNVGCSYTQSIVVSQPLAPLVATPTITNLICYGVPEGAIDITISGGTAPYVYYWNTGATTQDLSNLAAGSYSLAVTDANNCVTSIVVAVSEPASPLTVTYFATPASCYGYADGTVMLNITGGAPSYDILWSNGDTTNFIDSLLAGTYSAQITDANGCDAVINAIISQPQALIADFNIDATFGCAPLTVNLLNTSVGTIASSTWNFGNGSVSTSNNASYTYTQGGCYGISLTVMSPTGCLATTSIDSLVCVVTGPSAGFAATTTDIDYFTGQLELVNTSQGAITNYMWSFGDGSPNSTLENPIHYYPEETVDSYIVSLMVTDTNGCTDTVTHLFWLNEMLNVYVPNAITVTNDGLNEVFLPVFSNVDAVKDYDLWIYNRWGQLVFETDEIAEGWNGRYKDNKDVQLGVYTWKIRYVDNKGEARTLVGHVTVLR